ncbi:hypothetical protein NKH77_53645 [Streptomyces sp. M19]
MRWPRSSRAVPRRPAHRGVRRRVDRHGGAAFADRVRAVPGLPASHGVTRLVHPEAGELRLAHETLQLPADDDQRLVVHLPADGATSAALDRLTGRAPARCARCRADRSGRRPKAASGPGFRSRLQAPASGVAVSQRIS